MNAEFPSPLTCPELERTEVIVRAVGEQDSEHDIDLKTGDQPSAPRGRRNLGEIHRSENGRRADGESSEDSRGDNQREGIGERAANCAKQIERGDDL